MVGSGTFVLAAGGLPFGQSLSRNSQNAGRGDRQVARIVAETGRSPLPPLLPEQEFRDSNQLGHYQRVHHVVLLVLEDVAVPHVLEAAGSWAHRRWYHRTVGFHDLSL